ncbi:hypothetical protein BDY21DRAFT_307421 [Lineolata rhizophorae]|uniref:Protein kinase domain-containing protein n=1 Tax=Lineolata rhizophorae TaxID=578093 RepID=A0A6A6NV30_9PEZI|nr:hypothetical protein BDY21DRAFT_307421 [Lineolata rhizophorae]
MEMSYSPHSEAGGTLHLPSPTHPHSYRMDGFSISQIRRSLSRSPSKPSRHRLSPQNTPGSPISPLALSRAYSPSAKGAGAGAGACSNGSPTNSSESPFMAGQPHSAAKKNKFSLRRTAPFRSSVRTRSASQSPMRRALGEGANQGNTTPSSRARRTSGEENEKILATGTMGTHTADDKALLTRFDRNDAPIKFEFARSRADNNAPGANCLVPMKSSPLKRSDGIMNLDQASLGSPVAKRRSLHGPTSGGDWDVFDLAPSMNSESAGNNNDVDKDAPAQPLSSPLPKRGSPLRKSLSLRKSTLQQRHGPAGTRPKPASEQAPEFAIPGQAASKTRQRMSLDSSLPFAVGSEQISSPFRRSMHNQDNHPQQTHPFNASRINQPQQPQPYRHPLSNALTPSSSSSSMGDEAPQNAPPVAPERRSLENKPVTEQGQHAKTKAFSRSLPIGASRPQLSRAVAERGVTENGSFSTPEAYKMAKPLPAAFMSTGLISKRNRNIDDINNGVGYAMPDTPSKRVSFPPMNATPFSISKTSRPQHEFGTPTTPFSTHSSKPSPETFGKGVSIFGSRTGSHMRRGSFTSVDGDDNAHSPSGGHVDSQSSNDEMPPTPTKPSVGGKAGHSKENSLRSSLFGRRTSLTTDTFVPPSPGPETKPSSPKPIRNASPANSQDGSERASPHTPQETFLPPDPSGLSISGRDGNRNSSNFRHSRSSFGSFPPATPTAPRDQGFSFGHGQSVGGFARLTQNDVDTALTSRFTSVSKMGGGEFSQVFRVEGPSDNIVSTPSGSAHPTNVWAVKKNKRPYVGMKDRQKKLREVAILRALRGNNNIVTYTDSWESNNYLYIQTEFCENGNLKDFLAHAGFKARLDDFRIWKILLELTLGIMHIHSCGFIHLDLKPANVLIDWEGVLKIGDFGLASPWPAPKDIDGEGDREYIGPEILSGRFDKPADIFALGMIMLEIAGNIVLPDNGVSWQRLRAGDMSDLPSLTWSSESTLARDESGDPINYLAPAESSETLLGSDGGGGCGHHDGFPPHAGTALQPAATPKLVRSTSHDLVVPPNFMVDPHDPDCLDKVVQWLIMPRPDDRPSIEQLYAASGVQWVAKRRRSGATIYEGNWGPADYVLDRPAGGGGGGAVAGLDEGDVEMEDVC